MEIREIKILRFAGLKQFSLTLPGGFTFLAGANESGKSSLLSFIKAMLYGFRRGGKDPEKSERQRFRPWQSSEDFGGSLVLTIKEHRYRIERLFGSSRSQDRLSLWDEEKGQRIMLAAREEPGEYLLKLNEKEFAAACLIDEPGDGLQDSGLEVKLAALASGGDEELDAVEAVRLLRQYLRRIDDSSEDGLLTKCRRRCEELSSSLDAALDRDQARLDSLARLNAVEAKRKDIEHKLLARRLLSEKAEAVEKCRHWQDYLSQKQLARQIEQKEGLKSPLPMKPVPVRELNKLSQGQQKLLHLRAALHESEELYASKLAERQRAVSAWQSLESTKRRLLEEQAALLSLPELKEAQREQNDKAERLSRQYSVAMLSLLTLSALTTVIVSIVRQKLSLPLLLLSLFLPLILFLFAIKQGREEREKASALLRESQRRRAHLREIKLELEHNAFSRKQADAWIHDCETAIQEVGKRTEEQRWNLAREEKELRYLLKPWFLTLPENIPPEKLVQLLREYSLSGEESDGETNTHIQSRMDQKSTDEEERMRVEFEQASRKLQAVQQQLSQFNFSAADLQFSEEELRREEGQLREELGVERSQLRQLSSDQLDTANLERELKAELQQREELEKECRACQCSLDIVNLALEKYQAEAWPELRKRAENWLSCLSAGRYNRIQIDMPWKIHVLAPEDEQLHEEVYYSSGTRDLLWLSLKLAAASMLSSESLQLPLFMDDSLRRLDRKRAELAFSALKEEAEKKHKQLLLLSSSAEMRQFAETHQIPVYLLSSPASHDF